MSKIAINIILKVLVIEKLLEMYVLVELIIRLLKKIAQVKVIGGYFLKYYFLDLWLVL
jgi:hypothetical protein